MNWMKVLTLAALAMPATALAGRGHTEIEVENESGVRLEVRIDGERRGGLDPGQDRDFEVEPGHHTVVLRFQGETIHREDVYVGRGDEEHVDSPRLFADLRVTNSSRKSMLVAIGGDAPFWLGAGQSVSVPARIGDVRVRSWLEARSGKLVEPTDELVRVGRRGAEVRLEGRQPASLFVALNLPVSGQLLLDGQSVGWLNAWGQQRFEVRPGSYEATVVDANGRLLYRAQVQVGAGGEARIDVQQRAQARRPDSRQGNRSWASSYRSSYDRQLAAFQRQKEEMRRQQEAQRRAMEEARRQQQRGWQDDRSDNRRDDRHRDRDRGDNPQRPSRR